MSAGKLARLPADPDYSRFILTVRGQRVVLDSDLALIYDVPTKVLNQAVKRNAVRFPADFVFQLEKEELEQVQCLRSQFVTLKRGQHRKYLPFAFTEHGALMAANVLNSPRAAAMSIYIIRAFIRLREELSTGALAKRLALVERLLLKHDDSLRELYEQICQLLTPPDPPRREIGFHVKDGRERKVRRK